MSRPWPKPERSWRMVQQWRDLLFMHWPVPVEGLRPLVPDALPIDEFDGSAWIGVIPFRMTGIRFRGLPPIPGTSAFLELNVRTYVTVGGKPGVWFFSLDAASALAVAAARTWFHLPYWWARMSLRDDGGTIRYESRRRRDDYAYRAAYRPTGAVFRARPGDLDHFLVERYCLYAVTPKGRILRGEIDHEPWPLQPAEAEVQTNTMAPLPLPDVEPVLRFARCIEARIWTPERPAG